MHSEKKTEYVAAVFFATRSASCCFRFAIQFSFHYFTIFLLLLGQVCLAKNNNTYYCLSNEASADVIVAPIYKLGTCTLLT